MSEPTPTAPGKPARSRRLVVMLVLSAAFVALELMWFNEAQDVKRAVKELAEPVRAGLYARTLETLKTVCEPTTRPKGLRDFCRDQATLIVELPECDAECQALARAARKAGSS